MSNTRETTVLLERFANLLRIHTMESIEAANAQHSTSCSSIAEVIAVLFFNVMRYDPNDPRKPTADRFVLSKSHAAPLLYAAWAEAGAFPVSDLKYFGKIDSDLESHPTPRLNFIDVATGSFGQGLGCACGMAYAGKYFDKSDYRVYCVLGEEECSQGCVWESLAFASSYKLDNLCTVIDIHRRGQPDVETYRKRLDAFGWHSIVVNGHEINELLSAFKTASETKDKPTCILANTFDAKTTECLARLRQLIGGEPFIHPIIPKITAKVPEMRRANEIQLPSPPNYDERKEFPTCLAHATALEKLGKTCDRIVVLNAEAKNSMFTVKFRNTFPKRFIEYYIAEQNMVSVAIGIAARQHYICFVHTYAAFLIRTADQIRMGARSFTRVKYVGSHGGVLVGGDGPSQMALEDFALFRTLPDAVCFYPSDAVAAERAAELATTYDGTVYIRTSGANFPIVYKNGEVFEIGKAKIIVESSMDICTIVAGGVTLHEAMKASEKLKLSGRAVRVIDAFTIKPIDRETILKSARATKNRILVVEDHYPEGGLGEAVISALADQSQIKIYHLAVRELPRSGKPLGLLNKYGISAQQIIRAVQKISQQSH